MSSSTVPIVAGAGAGTGHQKIAFLILFAFFLLAPLVLYPVFLMKVMCFALFACAFNLLIGFGGLLSFGHAMFLGTAGYAAAHSAKVWGFNVPAIANRQSTFVNTGLRLLAVVSEEELTKARTDKNFKEEQVVVRGDRRLLQTAEIRGFDLVVQFDQFAKVLQARRDAFLQLTELLKRAEKDEDKSRIQTQLDQTRELLEKGNKEMLESVGYSITHNYEVEILESKFVILLNQEEVNQIMAAAQQQQAAAAPVAVEAPKLEKKAEKKN